MKEVIKKLLRESLLFEKLYHGTNRKELNWEDRNESSDFNMLGYGIYLTDIKDEAKYYAKNKAKGIKYVHSFKPINANIVNWDGPLPKTILDYINNNNGFFTEKITVDFDAYSVGTNNGTLEWDFLDEDLPQWAIDDNLKPGYFIMQYDKNYKQVGETFYGLTKEEVLKIANKFNNGQGIVFDIDPNVFYGITGIEDNKLNTKNMLLSVANFYTFIYYKLGSTKKASNFLVGLNIDGVTKQQDTSDFGYSDQKPNITVIFNPKNFKLIKTSVVK